nr:MAG TPA: hypothetical protein [Microviridae sp.]
MPSTKLTRKHPYVVFIHVSFRVGRDAAPGTDRMVYKRSADHRSDNKRKKE